MSNLNRRNKVGSLLLYKVLHNVRLTGYFQRIVKTATRIRAILPWLVIGCVPAVAYPQAELASSWNYDPVWAALSLTYSPDGKLFAVGGNWGAQIYRASPRELITSIPTPSGQVWSMAFSPDGKTLAIGGWVNGNSNQPVLELVNPATGTFIRSLPTFAGIVESLAFSPDGKTLAVGGTNNTALEIWNVASGSLVASLPTSMQFVYAVAYSPNGATLAAGGSNGGSVEIWDVASEKRIRTLPSRNSTVGSLSFSPDGKSLADGGIAYQSPVPGFVEIWESSTWTNRTTLNINCYSIVGIAYSPNSQLLAIGELVTQGSGDVKLLDTSADNHISTLVPANQPEIGAIAFTPDGKELTIAIDRFDSAPSTYSTELETWDVHLKVEKSVLNVDPYNNGLSLAYSADGHTLAVGGCQSFYGSSGGRLCLWDNSSGQLISSLPTSAAAGVVSLAFSPDRSKLVDCGQAITGPVLEVWNPPTGVLQRSLPTTADKSLACVAISPNGAFLADGGLSSAGGTLEIWELSSGKLLANLATNANIGIQSVAFTPNGKDLIVCGKGYAFAGYIYGVVEVWDIATNGLVASLPTSLYAPSSVAVSHDGKMLAVGGQLFIANPNSTACAIELWDLSKSEVVATLPVAPNPNPVVQLAFTLDGATLVAATSVGIQAFGTSSYESLASYLLGPVNAIALTPDGTQLARIDNTNLLTVATTPNFGLVSISGITFNPSTIMAGTLSTATITLSKAPAKGGSIIALASSNAAAIVPAEVSVQAGAKTATFTVMGGAVNSQTTSTITATSGNSFQSAQITTNPAAVTSLVLSQSSSPGGNSTIGTVTLSGPAGSNGVVIAFTSDNPVAWAASTISIQEGQSRTIFVIDTSAVSAIVKCKLTASAGGRSKSAMLTVTPATVGNIDLNEAILEGGMPVNGYVWLNGTASTGGVSVTLSSNSPDVILPQTVTVPADQNYATFTGQSKAVSIKTNVLIRATVGSRVADAFLELTPLLVQSLSCDQVAMQGGGTATGTILLNGLAPTGGVSVSVSSSLNSVSVPSSVLVPAGQTTATFTVQTSPVGAQARVTLTAQLGLYSASWPLIINPPPLSAFTISPASVQGGQAVSGTVSLASAAPTGGVAISVTCDSNSATVPTTVTIPAGQTAVTFTITTTKVATTTTANISVALAGTSMSFQLTIT